MSICESECTLGERGCYANDPSDVLGVSLSERNWGYMMCRHFTCPIGMLEAKKQARMGVAEDVVVGENSFLAVPFATPEKSVERYVIVGGNNRGQIITSSFDGTRFLSPLKLRLRR